MQRLPILVTGAAGFIGARFVESCNQRGQAVISVDLEEHFRAREEHQDLDFGTIVDREELFGWLAREEPELESVVHLGACSRTTETNVDFLNEVNVEYSKRIWAFTTRRSLPLVYASSAATYGDGAMGFADDENQIPKLKPLNAYGQSKQDFDLWALEQDRQGTSPPSWAGFKFFNVYGFGERHKRDQASVVLHAFDQLRDRGRVKLFQSHREGVEHGHQKRDFVFVGDAVDAIHFALEKPIPRGIFNLGTGEARTFLDLARAVFAATGTPEQIDFVPTPLEIRDRYQYFTEASMERLRAAGYSKPFTSLEDGVRQTVGRLQASSGN